MPAGRLSTSKPLYRPGGGGVIVAFLVPITVLLSAFIVPFFWFAPAWRPEGQGDANPSHPPHGPLRLVEASVRQPGSRAGAS